VNVELSFAFATTGDPIVFLLKQELGWGVLILVIGLNWSLEAKALLSTGYDPDSSSSQALPVSSMVDKMYFSSRQVSSSSSSSSSGYSQLQSEVTLSAQDLVLSHLWLQVRGVSSPQQVFVNGQPLGLSSPSAPGVLLNPYLRSGMNTVQLSGSGATELEFLLLQTSRGSQPDLTRDILIHQNLSRSGSGSWQARLIINVL
jgi:hypothetical protein